MHTFFSNTIDEIVQLDEQESKHAVKVLRLNVGDKVVVIDGKGTIATASIIDNHFKRCTLQVIDKQVKPQLFRKAIAIAPTKSNDRIEWFLEKATEIGITDFLPMITSNSERKKINFDRWKKVVLAATKQSHRAWMPVIHDLQNFTAIIQDNGFSSKFIAHCYDEQKSKFIKSEESMILLIGPEGDFSIEEVNLALDNDFQSVSLGVNRLRTETAGVVGATLMCI